MILETHVPRAQFNRLYAEAMSQLAAVTAERDHARREVEHQKWIKAQNTEVLTGLLDQARQMLADEVESLRIQRDNSDRRATECVQAMQSLDAENRQLHAVLADAPHDKTCGSHPMNGIRDLGCSCWKAVL